MVHDRGLVAEQLRNPASRATVAYYFFDFIRKESLSIPTFLRSILHQLIRIERLHSSMQRKLEEIFIGTHGQREPDIEEVEALILELSAESNGVIFIIDGIDVLEQVNSRYILRFLKDLLSRLECIKFFISSQSDADIAMSLGIHQVIPIKIKSHDLNSDIQLFVENQVQNERVSGLLRSRFPDLVDTIKQSLAVKAEGM